MRKRVLWIAWVSLMGLLSAHTAQANTYEDVLRAREMGDLPTVQRLLARGVAVDTTDENGNTLLMLSARDNQRKMLEWLLLQHSRVAKKNRHGDDALMLAALKGHREIVQILLLAGAEVNPSGWTALSYAAFEGWKDIVQLLLQHGAKINAQAPNGMTALMVASRNGELATVKYLLERGADPELTDQAGDTALQIARAAANSKNPPARIADVVQVLETLQPEVPVVLHIQAAPAEEKNSVANSPSQDVPEAVTESSASLLPSEIEAGSYGREFKDLPTLELKLQYP